MRLYIEDTEKGGLTYSINHLSFLDLLYSTDEPNHAFKFGVILLNTRITEFGKKYMEFICDSE